MVTSSGSPILDAIQKSVEETVAAETRRVSPRVGETVEVRTASIPHTLPAPKPQPAPPQQRHVRPHPPVAKRGAKEARQQPRTTAAQLPVRAVHNTPSQLHSKLCTGDDRRGSRAWKPARPPTCGTRVLRSLPKPTHPECRLARDNGQRSACWTRVAYFAQ